MVNLEAQNDIMLLHNPIKNINSIIYDNINGDLIRKCVTKIKGSSGPTCLDADFWKKILCNTVYGDASDDLYHAIALMTRKLCGEVMDDLDSIQALMACRLILLDKYQGIRSIGIAEVLRQIIGKAVKTIVKPDILANTEYDQLCARQRNRL